MTETIINPESVGAYMTSPPYAPSRFSIIRSCHQFLILFKIFMTEYRSSWPFQVFSGVLLPCGFIFFLKTIGGNLAFEQKVFLVSGNMVTSVAFGPAFMLIVKMGWARQNREFDYWAALPVAKSSLVLALVSVTLVFTLPGIFSVYVLGTLMLGLPLLGGLILLPLIPLGSLSLSGLGAFLGSHAKDGHTGTMFANFLIGFVTFLSPVLVPIEALPLPLRIIAYFTPTTYIARAFRAALSGRVDTSLAVDVLIIILFCAFFLILGHRKLDWRGD